MLTRSEKLPVVIQSERGECGLACLVMLLFHFGHKIDLNTMRKRCKISQHGVTLKSLLALSEKFHLNARPLRVNLSDLKRLQLPAILHWDMNHFVVLKKTNKNDLYIHDPAIGEKKLSIKEAGVHFSGIAVELYPSQDFEKKEELRRLHFKDLWQSGFSGTLIQIFVYSLLLQVFSLSLPFFTQIFIDDVLVNNDISLLEVLALGFLIVTIMKSLIDLVRSNIVLYLSSIMNFHMANSICRHLLHLPLNYFSSRHMGDIVSRFNSVNHIRQFFSNGIIEIILDGLMVIGTLCLMFYYSVTLTLIVLAAAIGYGFLRIIFYPIFFQRNQELLKSSASEKSLFMENIRAIQGIKLFNKERDRLNYWQNLYAEVINADIKIQKLAIYLRFAHGLIVGLEMVAILLIAGKSVIGGTLSVGMVIAYFHFKDQFNSRVFSLLDKYFEMKLLDVHLGRMADIVFTEQENAHFFDEDISIPSVNLGSKTKSDISLTHLSVADLSFKYGAENDDLFSNVSLAVSRQESIAIIGPSGCGKSTLLKVLMSLLKPGAGQIMVNGLKLTDSALQVYRSKIAGVLQDDSLFSGTISENISFFDSSPDQARIQQVAQLAAINDDIVSLPMQYNTLVGSMGAALSGGQIQRILLARALYKRPEILLLDEASSHLDVETEWVINQTLKKLSLTTIIVAHRPQTVLMADKIYQLTPSGLNEITHQAIKSSFSQAENLLA